MRSKEEAHDYRYFPEPDLPPLVVSTEWVEKVRSTLPELPGARKYRFIRQYGLSFDDAGTLTSTSEIAEYYEAVVRTGAEARTASNWMLSELLFLVKNSGRSISAGKVSPQNLAALIGLIAEGSISGKIAKDVLVEMFQSGRDPSNIVSEQGLNQISDAGQIETIIRRVCEANPKQVADYRSGKDKLFAFFVGQVMKETAGKANPALVNDLLKKLLA